MDFFVFECADDSDINIITDDPDEASIPADAGKFCTGQWTLIDQFSEGDGTYPPDKEMQIKDEIDQKGYYAVLPPGLKIDME